MAIYWIVSYSILVFCFFELAMINQASKTETKVLINYFFLIGVLALILFAGMRGPDSGMDDSQYVGFFHDFSRQTGMTGYQAVADIYRYENFFMLLAWLASCFTHESYFFLLFISFIAVSTNAWVYKKYSPLILCSLCLYSAHLFINKDMNQIRFGLCSAFAIAFICSLVARNYLLSLLFIILSTQSHSTGYTIVMIIPFFFIRERKYLPLMVVLASIPLGIIGGKKLFLDSLGIVPVLGERAASYSGTNFDTTSPVFGLANLKNIAFIGAFTLYYFRNGIMKEDRFVYILLVAYSIGAAVRITFSDFSIFGGRVGNLFLHTEPLLFAFLMLRIRNLLLNFIMLFSITTYYLAYNTILSAQSILGYSVAPLFRIFS
ncbi:exopolysaccharide biosynthesis protein WceL [Erwinia sp. Ejp617]|nr:EpsG family protein [Erwinia sp. Ejp617]ADP12987.1 exopolysaccharide biosynthesis protein WceL [Erwinia sp. Ejp617]